MLRLLVAYVTVAQLYQPKSRHATTNGKVGGTSFVYAKLDAKGCIDQKTGEGSVNCASC
jgi:hypothetical protein